MKRNPYILIALAVIFFNTSCKDGGVSLANEKPVFTLTDSSETGFFFWNEVQDTEQLNYFLYGYFYNGGGVAVGDINNDGLPDIYMVGNTFGGRLYLNKGDFKFEQITNTSNTHVTGGFTHGVTMADVNKDGYLDIYLSRSMTAVDSFRANVLYINNKDNTFTDRAKEYGIDDMGFTMQSNFFDYDKDGDLDLYVLNHRNDWGQGQRLGTKEQRAKLMAGVTQEEYNKHASRLYRNNGNGTFTDVTKQAGVYDIVFGLSATVADVNQDGWPDLYTTSDFRDKDHLYINNGNGTFSDKIHSALGHISMNSMGSEMADFNNDGLLDIVTLDMMAEDNYRQKQLQGPAPYDVLKTSMDYGYHCQLVRNCLHKNNGDGTYSEIGQLAGVSHTDWSWAPLLADFDNDGKKDLFVTNGYPNNSTDMDYLKYTSDEIIKESRITGSLTHMALINALESTPLQNYMYKNKGEYQFENKATDWGLTQKAFSSGAAYADLDLDGDLDLIVNNFNEPSFLYKNNTAENNPKAQFLSFTFKSDQQAQAQGTKIKLFTESGMQFQELTSNRGYLSAVHPILHFGIAMGESVTRVEITYPNNTIQEISKPELNQYQVLDINAGKPGSFTQEKQEAQALTEITNAFSPAYKHTESDFNDFKDEPLLEQMCSNRGPYLSTGDANKDGLEDIYISGAAGYSGQLYLQTANAKFILKANPKFIQDKMYEDGQAVFFDADKDGDMDLYVTSGSNEVRYDSLFINRLYLNDGKGNYTRATLPAIRSNTLAVKALDIDGDQDLDLVVGGNVIPKAFPTSYASYILLNGGKGDFTLGKDILPNDGKLGIVNDMAILDINSDGKPDIVSAGDWAPIQLLLNANGKFNNKTKDYGLHNTNGLWNCLALMDVNGDGKQDIVAGNRGLNNFFACSEEQPATLYYDDFDHNGDKEGVVNYYFRDGVLYPKYTLDEILAQMPSLKGMFPRYKDYSTATAQQIFTKSKYANMQTFTCKTFSSAVFLAAEESFTSHALPIKSQLAPIYGIANIGTSSNPSILTVGNNYSVDINIGRYDADYGAIAQWDSKRNALVTSPERISIAGEKRSIKLISGGASKILVVSRNNGMLSVYKGRL